MVTISPKKTLIAFTTSALLTFSRISASQYHQYTSIRAKNSIATMKKTFSRLTFAATYIGIVSAAGNLRGDIRGTSLSSQPENVPKAEYGVINFDLFDVSLFPCNLLSLLLFYDDRCRCDCLIYTILIMSFTYSSSTSLRPTTTARV